MIRDELIGNLICKLGECSNDELLIVRSVLSRLALGRERYGAWVADGEPRNFKRERTEEILDALVYGAMMDVVRGDSP